MIHFYENLVAKTLETVKSAYDCADVYCDLLRINEAIKNAKQGSWAMGLDLDQEMRRKYPVINRMDQFANALSTSIKNPQKHSNSEIVVSNLNEDYYGILCETAIKKGIIHSVKEFIKSVD